MRQEPSSGAYAATARPAALDRAGGARSLAAVLDLLRRRLSGEFHLTRKEDETALGLYTMGSVDELARCTGRSVHTVRTQLKAAMHKTGTHTQAGLVALVANRLNP